MDKHLRIILELVSSGFASGARGATNIFKGFIGGIMDGAKSAAQSLMSLTQTIFFVREALNTLAQAGRWVFDTFIKGAGDAAKFEAKLKNLTGSADDAQQIMAHLRDIATSTGANFDELASGAQLMAVAAKDASGAFDLEMFKGMNDQLVRLAAVRPDVPIDRLARGIVALARGDWQSLEMFLDVSLRKLIGLEEETKKASKLPTEISQGPVTAVRDIEESVGDATENLALLEEAMQKMGATKELIEEVAELSGLERFQQILADIARTIGVPLFEALNKELSKLSDWFKENPEKVERIATLIGETLAGAMEDLFEALEKVDWDKVVDDFDKLVTALSEGDLETAKETLKGIGDALQAIGTAMQTITNTIQDVGDFFDRYNEWNTNLANQPTGQSLGQISQDIGKALNEAPLARQIEHFLRIEVTSDNDMFNAHVKQIADGAATDALNVVADEMEEGQQ